MLERLTSDHWTVGGLHRFASQCVLTRFTTLRITRWLARWRCAAVYLLSEVIAARQAASKLELRRAIDATQRRGDEAAAEAAARSNLHARLENCVSPTR